MKKIAKLSLVTALAVAGFATNSFAADTLAVTNVVAIASPQYAKFIFFISINPNYLTIAKT